MLKSNLFSFLLLCPAMFLSAGSMPVSERPAAGSALPPASGGKNVASARPVRARIASNPRTFCNPVNLNYRFMKINGGDGIREAADPVVTPFDGSYFLFASKSSGYWYSDDFNVWTHVFISDEVLPVEDYAPAAFAHDGYLYYMGSASGHAVLYRSSDPRAGKWDPVARILTSVDPAFYVEGDTLYLYQGCSPENPILVQAFDLHTFQPQSALLDCFNSVQKAHGWERPGEENELPRRPYIEGAWMTAHGGRYYLQYAAPGTEWKSYADGAYVADSPLGPFTYMPGSPVSYKPGGFIGGAGHGCMFTVGDNYWKAATNSISVRHMFERRLSFYPAGFDKDGDLYTDTYLGDYPMLLPSPGKRSQKNSLAGWMLLSAGRPVTASSSFDGYPAVNAVDENARTAWVAATNDSSEWLQVDLLQPVSVHAVQVNFDEYGATGKGYRVGVFQRYRIEASNDGTHWYPVADRSEKDTDTPHDYIEFERPFKARYLRLQNVEYTVSPNLSVRDLRVFGRGTGSKPAPVREFSVSRDPNDPCRASLSWEAVPGAQGYVVRYGIAPAKLYNSFQVPDATSLKINSLNSGTGYYFTVDAYNEKGVSFGKTVVECK